MTEVSPGQLDYLKNVPLMIPLERDMINIIRVLLPCLLRDLEAVKKEAAELQSELDGIRADQKADEQYADFIKDRDKND